MLPPIYQHATVRSVSRGCEVTGRVGISVDLPDGTTRRLALDLKDARFLHAGLVDYLAWCGCQACSSSGSPSADGSPHDGHSLAPLATSSAAPAGCAYEPSASSSNVASQRPSLRSRIQKVPARVRWLKATMLCMVRALSMGGWWNFHSRGVPRAAPQAPAAINQEANGAV